MVEIPEIVRPFFVAGWYPGRAVAVPSKVPIDRPAFALLRELGGLAVGKVGTGQECATDDMVFAPEDPSEDQAVEVWSGLLGSPLVCLAEVHHAHGELYIDGRGRCFELSMIHDAFSFAGATFGEAAERMLLGRRVRPMLRPDQRTVTLYGDTFDEDHPSVYRY